MPPRSAARAALLLRFRLTERRRIAIVHAPPASGKTTAIRHYLERQPASRAILTVRREHAGVAPFARALAEALAPVAPELQRHLASAFLGARRQARPWNLVARWFAGRLRSPMTIVVDELHRIADDEPTLQFLAQLVDAAPAHVRWLLGVRSTASLPVPRWLAAGDADVSIDEDVLRLHEDEIRALAAARRVAPQTAARIGAAPAALICALAALPDLDADVLAELPYEAGPLAGDAAPVDALHDFIRAEAVARVSDASDDARAGQTAAARALERNGRTAEALQLYVAARATDDVARILDERGFALYASGSADIVCTAIESLPEAERRRSAVALTIEAIDESSRGRYDVSESWFEHALRQARDADQRMYVDVAFAVELLRRDRSDALERLEALARVATEQTLAVTVLASLATAHAQAGHVEIAEGYRAQALAALSSVDNDAIHATVHQRAAFVALTCGHIADAAHHAKLAATRADEQGNYELRAVAETVRCVVAYSFDDDLTQTLETLDRIGEAGSLLKNGLFRRFSLTHAYLIYAERGDAAALARLEAQLADEELESSRQHVDEGLLPARALACCWLGDFHAAYEMLSPTGGRQPVPEMLALRWAEIALYAAVAGPAGEAREALASVQRHLREHTDAPSVDALRATLLAAVAAVLAGAGDDADRLLLDAIAAVERWPRWRPFLAFATALRAASDDATETMLGSLEAMHDAGLGGWARMLEHLPARRVSGAVALR